MMYFPSGEYTGISSIVFPSVSSVTAPSLTRALQTFAVVGDR